MPSTQTVFARVRDVVADYVNVDSSQLRPQDHLQADLGCDSLDLVEISMELEEAFDIDVPDEVGGADRTLQEIADFVAAEVAAR